MAIYFGELICIDEDGAVELVLWADYSDPDRRDSPADLCRHDAIPLGTVDRIRRPAGMCLVPGAEDELANALDQWREEQDGEQDATLELTRDYNRSVSPLYA